MTEIVPIKRYTAVSEQSYHGKNYDKPEKPGLTIGEDEIVIDE
jgi:formate dehydrogenase accessory protein FdhD